MTTLLRIAIPWPISLASLHATEWFVAPPPLGADTNPGAPAQPFATIDQGAAAAQAGDTVWIKPGTYQPSSPIMPANSGTSTCPITYRAQAGGQVIIDGLRVINSGFFGILIKGSSSNIIVWNCSTFFTGASGICASTSSNIKVLNNTVPQACIAEPTYQPL